MSGYNRDTVRALWLLGLVASGCGHDCLDGIHWASPGVRVLAGVDAARSTAHVHASVVTYSWFDDHGGDETGCAPTYNPDDVRETVTVGGVTTELGSKGEAELAGLATEYAFQARRGGDTIDIVARAPSFPTITLTPDPPRAGEPFTVSWSPRGEVDTWICVDAHDLTDVNPEDKCGTEPWAPSPEGRSVVGTDAGELVIEGFRLIARPGTYELNVHRVRQGEGAVDGYSLPWVDVVTTLRRTVTAGTP